MKTAIRLGIGGAIITLGVVLALVAAVMATSDAPVHASSAPDLRTYGTELAMNLETPRVGGTFRIKVWLENRGGTESGDTTLRFYRSADETITTSDTEVATAEVTSMEAGERRGQDWVDITAPSTEGTYYYGVCVDAVTDESDTTNNCRHTSFEVPVPLPRPDLVVQTPSVNDATLETGEAFTLSATVANSGNWQSAGTTLRYYRSTDATVTTADTEVGTDSVTSLLYTPFWGGV